MKQPYLTVGLSQQNGEPSLQIVRNDKEPYNEMNPKLEDLNALGGLGAREKVGQLILLMLNRAFLNDFEQFPELVETPVSMNNPRDCFDYLVMMSMSMRTDKLVDNIDNLFNVFPKDLVGTDAENEWKILKPKIETMFKGK